MTPFVIRFAVLYDSLQCHFAERQCHFILSILLFDLFSMSSNTRSSGRKRTPKKPFSPEADKVAKQRKGGKGEKAPPEIDRNIVLSENVSKI